MLRPLEIFFCRIVTHITLLAYFWLVKKLRKSWQIIKI